MRDVSNKSWETKTLGEVCKFTGGGTPSKQNPKFWGGDIPWVSPKDMKSEVVFDSIDHISETAIEQSAAKRIPEGSILIVVRSGILARTIPTAIAGKELTVNQDIKAIIPGNRLDRHFLAHFLRSAETHLLEQVTRGATVHKLDMPVIKSLPIPLPPLEEQQRIVAVLDEAFEGLTRARAHAEANLKNARELFESATHAAFSDLDVSRATLGDVCEIYQPKTISAKEMEPEGKYTVFGANGPIGKYSKYNHEEPQLLVTCRGATCGSVNISDPFSWITGNAMVIRPKDQRLTRDFLEYFFRGAVDLKGVITGAAQPQITRKSLSPVLVPTPSPDVQARIVDSLESTKASSEQLVYRYTKKLQDLDDLRQSLLQKAFAGQLT